jgi:DNA recombination protein RmuC
MSTLLLVAGAALAALAGALLASWMERRLRAALIAQATADVTVRAATQQAELATQVAASEQRGHDLLARLHESAAFVTAREGELRDARDELTRLRTDATTWSTRLEEQARSHGQLKEAFGALSADALARNNEQFLQLARTELDRVRVAAQAELTEKEVAIQGLVAPIREGLERYDRRLHEVELARVESFAALAERLELMSVANDVLRGETANLARALRSSNVRGAWGELQLKRAVELAGMLEHCDFTTQHTVGDEDATLRPDMVIRLPGDKTIVVDAKTPATAVLEAVNCPDDARRRQLCLEHVVAVKKHIEALSRKAYWEQFPNAPEFVVLFLPSEAFFSAALEFDPALFEHSFAQKVIIATPTTLVALLKAVAFGWRQDAIARNAQEISDLGRDLYERIRTLAEHFDDVGSHLGKSVSAYNRAVGALERRVLPQARRFQSLGAGGTTPLPELRSVELAPLPIAAPELLGS